MNSVILMGRLTRDPEMRYTKGEPAMVIARYTLAVDRRGKREEGGCNTDFISCVSFGRTAEFTEKYLRKGIKVVITGRIQTGSYTKPNREKVYTTDVVVEECEFAESKNAENKDAGSVQAALGTGSNALNHTAGDGFMRIPDGIEEELPFD